MKKERLCKQKVKRRKLYRTLSVFVAKKPNFKIRKAIYF